MGSRTLVATLARLVDGILLGFDSATGRLVGSKRPTTSAEMSEGVWHCFEAGGVGGADLAAFVHGSTGAITTIIERSGA